MLSEIYKELEGSNTVYDFEQLFNKYEEVML